MAARMRRNDSNHEAGASAARIAASDSCTAACHVDVSTKISD